MTSPAIGTFLRPVGVMRFAYCYRLDRIWPAEPDGEWGPDPERWSCTRFGMGDDLDNPVDDGHLARGHSVTDMVPVAPGVWRRRTECSWRGEPLYWLTMRPRGQQELFS